MQVQNLLKFPSVLLRVRAQIGIAQKAASLALGLNQAHFCGVEKGRRPPLDDEKIGRLRSEFHISEEALDDLKWAARHDRYLRALYEATATGEEARLMSSVLSASRLLDTSQREGLCDYLSSLQISAEQMRGLSARPSRPSTMGRSVTMT